MITIGLSIATYYLIENPIRKINTKKIVICLLVMMMLFSCVTFFVFNLARLKNNHYE